MTSAMLILLALQASATPAESTGQARERKDRDAAEVALKQQEGKEGEAATQRLFDQQNEFFKSVGAKKPN